MKIKNIYSIFYLILLLYVISNLSLSVSCFDTNELNPIKDGITSSLTINGAIKGFSFEEKNEINRIAEIENYFPKIRRKIEDGRFCAKIFVSERKTYFDCTTSRTPEGEISDKEWCYVDPDYNNKGNWGFCIPNLDFDKVRGNNFIRMQEITKLISNLNMDVSQNIPAAQRSLEVIKDVSQIQKKIEEKVKDLDTKTKAIHKKLNNLQLVKNELDQQEKNLKLLFFQIDTKQQKKQVIYKKSQSNNQKTVNCKGMLLYEDDNEGEGLIAQFYNNENWLGPSKKSHSKEINFDWTNTQPIEGINPNNFSVRWEGWIKSPIQEEYTFSIITNGGVEMYLDNERIIQHNTNSLIESYIKFSKNKNSSHKPNEKIDPFRADSSPIKLISQIKYKIVIRFFHSIHTTSSKNDQVFIKLLWKTEDFQESVIPSNYLFTLNDFNNLKITDYLTEDGVLRRLHENDTAFKNSDNYILQDIPTELLNLYVLKFDTLYKKDSFMAETNAPTVVYIALLDHYPNPLGIGFEDSGYTMSLLEIDKNSPKGSKNYIAKKSAKLNIYKRNYRRGNIKIQFNKLGLNSNGIPMIIFFSFDINSRSLTKCTGKEFLISDSTSRFFNKCIASSELSGYGCRDGFNNKMRDEEGGIWAAKADGIGAWVQIYFNGVYKINSIEYLNRKNPSERNKQIEISFSSGDSRIFNLKNDDKKAVFFFDTVRTRFVKFTIKEVYATLNNGGAFNIYGLECKATDKTTQPDKDIEIPIINSVNNESSKTTPMSVKSIAPLFMNDYIAPIYLNCYESLSNSNKFNSLNLSVNDKILIKCPESCANAEVEIYGDEIYSKDSGICKAAFHNKKISYIGGLVRMVIKREMQSYRGSLSNGVKSLGRIFGIKSLSFEMYEDEDVILLKPGSKVDLRIEDKEIGNKWAPAIITKVLDTINGKFVNLILDGQSSKTMEVPYPEKEKIHPCGQHVKYRDCKGSVKLNSNKQSILIRFVTPDYLISLSPDDAGYLQDKGDIFGYDNKPYGWSENITNKIIRRFNPKEPLMETFIKFPPYPDSSSCNQSQPEENCEPISWKVKAGKGKFKIKIYVGDTNKDRIVNLKINDKFMAKNKLIPRNTLEVIAEILDSKNEIFELTSECTEDCDDSRSIINAIELFPVDSKIGESATRRIEKETNCGNSLTGGQCDHGPIVLHCLFDDPSAPSAKYCNGEYSLISIPPDYKCSEQFGQYKCVNKMYSDASQCKLHCPRKCNDSKCIY